MKKFLALLLLSAILGLGIHATYNRFKSFEPEARSASGSIFITKNGERTFACSGTEIGKTTDGGGVFLTARHCVASVDTNKIYDGITVSFSANEGGPYYDAQPVALSLSDDLALLYLRDGADIPEVKVKDERNLSGGSPIFNVSFPLGTGKILFHGEYIDSHFPVLPEEAEAYPQWSYAMPVNITVAPGSSGSGLFSQRQRALIGVTVGTFGEGGYNVAIPSDRVIDFLNDLRDNTVEKFKQAFQEKEDLEHIF